MKITARDSYEVADVETIEKRLKRFRPTDFARPEKPLLVSDLDDVLVNITCPWAELVVKGLGLDPALSSPDRVLKRDSYFLNEHLGVTHPQILEFYCVDDFYDELVPTSLAAGVAASLEAGRIEVVIISHTFEENKKSKKRFCEKYFPKARHVLVEGTKSKGEVINEEGLSRYSTFVDDSPANIHDVVMKTMSFGKEFMLPDLGFNNPLPRETLEELLRMQASLSYYERVL